MWNGFEEEEEDVEEGAEEEDVKKLKGADAKDATAKELVIAINKHLGILTGTRVYLVAEIMHHEKHPVPFGRISHIGPFSDYAALGRLDPWSPRQ